MQDMVRQMNMRNRTYQELLTIPTFEERFEYLKLEGSVGVDTFGYDRYLNQILYKSSEWRKFRNEIIVRDNGCDLAFPGFEIYGQKILIHHINPITVEDVVYRSSKVFDPNNVVTTILNTHNAIHYGDADLLTTGPVERTPNDTCPWKR